VTTAAAPAATARSSRACSSQRSLSSAVSAAPLKRGLPLQQRCRSVELVNAKTRPINDTLDSTRRRCERLAGSGPCGPPAGHHGRFPNHWARRRQPIGQPGRRGGKDGQHRCQLGVAAPAGSLHCQSARLCVALVVAWTESSACTVVPSNTRLLRSTFRTCAGSRSRRRCGLSRRPICIVTLGHNTFQPN